MTERQQFQQDAFIVEILENDGRYWAHLRDLPTVHFWRKADSSSAVAACGLKVPYERLSDLWVESAFQNGGECRKCWASR